MLVDILLNGCIYLSFLGKFFVPSLASLINQPLNMKDTD